MSIETIVLGGGCFWCTEAIFKEIRGVSNVESGYAGGNTINPSYEEVCSGNTGHAEVIRVEFDNEEIKLPTILKIFFYSHDPTSLNKQGADSGTQYRSIILYSDEVQKEIIDKFIQELNNSGDFKNPIVTEVKKLDVFYVAEDYHQNYLRNNRFAPYCMIVINPKLAKVRAKFKQNLKGR